MEGKTGQKIRWRGRKGKGGTRKKEGNRKRESQVYANG